MNTMAIQTTTVLGPETKHQYLQIDLKVIRTLIARFRMIVNSKSVGTTLKRATKMFGNLTVNIKRGISDARYMDGKILIQKILQIKNSTWPLSEPTATRNPVAWNRLFQMSDPVWGSTRVSAFD